MTYDLPIYSGEDLAKATSYPPLECGRYKFRVIERQEGVTKTGNHMEKLIFEVYHRGAGKKPMKCYHNFFIEKDVKNPSHMYDIKKIKDFLDCIGVEYTKDAFERVVNREGVANFYVDNYMKDGSEREKFTVADDSFTNTAPSPTQIGAAGKIPSSEAKPQDFDDNIPF